MFLLTLHDMRLHKTIRKVFQYLGDAEDYCDWLNNYQPHIDIDRLEYCDFFPDFEDVENEM